MRLCDWAILAGVALSDIARFIVADIAVNTGFTVAYIADIVKTSDPYLLFLVPHHLYVVERSNERDYKRLDTIIYIIMSTIAVITRVQNKKGVSWLVNSRFATVVRTVVKLHPFLFLWHP